MTDRLPELAELPRDLVLDGNAGKSGGPVLDELDLPSPRCLVGDVFDDGDALFQAICDRGPEGVVAKRQVPRRLPRLGEGQEPEVLAARVGDRRRAALVRAAS
jgi:hypothetical protein